MSFWSRLGKIKRVLELIVKAIDAVRGGDPKARQEPEVVDLTEGGEPE